MMYVSEQLNLLGWSINELSERLGLDIGTVTSWGIFSANTRVPKYAKAYLDLAVQNKMFLNEINRLVKRLEV